MPDTRSAAVGLGGGPDDGAAASNAAAATPPMMCRRFNFEIMRVSFKNVIPE